MAIQQCDLVLVHIYPQGEDTLVSDRPKKEVGANQEESHYCSDHPVGTQVNKWVKS